MSEPDSINEICTLRIELPDSNPLIWRQLEVPTSITLKSLHEIIQAAMGWDDYHLWEFAVGRQTFGPPMIGGWAATPRRAATKVRLGELLKPRKTTIDYLYDFGDSWEHRLIFTNIRAGDADVDYPRYIAGECNAPPEDCGGIPGFYDKLETIADPSHPEHDEIKQWLGDYDPNIIDEMKIKIALGRIAKRVKAARIRLGKPKT